MNKIGLFYGTDTGNTEMVAKMIKEKLENILGENTVDIFEIYEKSKADMEPYQKLIIGMPTWYDGELQGDWEEFLPEFEQIDFKGRSVAFFGLGDQYGYAAYFCDGLGVFAETVEKNGGKLCGLWPTKGYEHDFSKAERDGVFVGLCIDIENQDELTEKRLNKWLPQIIAEMELNSE